MGAAHNSLHRLLRRFDHACHYCARTLYCLTCHPVGLPDDPAARPGSRDHVIPRSKGGAGGANLVAACLPCNQAKADRDPDERELALLPIRTTQRQPQGRRAVCVRQRFQTEDAAAAYADLLAYRRSGSGATFQPRHCSKGGTTHWHVEAARAATDDPAMSAAS